MIIIRFQGGLGNQLFQYALYKELEFQGKEVYADLTIYESDREPREFELYKLGLSVKEAGLSDINKMCPLGQDFFTKVKKNTLYRNKFYKEKNPIVYDSYFHECTDKYLIGYWQTEKYFKNVSEEIRKEIEFTTVNEKLNKSILNEIKKTNSISVHMRFGDYVGNDMYDDICTKKYYLKAIEKMKSLYSDVKLFVISDDIERAKQVLIDENCEYIDWNVGKDSYYDMKLISSCKHNIMANSSFSWWGTWLNSNKEKKVIAPSYWLKNISQGDIWCESWIKITPEGEVVNEAVV